MFTRDITLLAFPNAFLPLSIGFSRARLRTSRAYFCQMRKRVSTVGRCSIYAATRSRRIHGVGPDGWIDPVAIPAYVFAPRCAAAASRPRSSGQRLDLLSSFPVRSPNHVGLFTFFHSPRRRCRPFASFLASSSFFPSLSKVAITFAPGES